MRLLFTVFMLLVLPSAVGAKERLGTFQGTKHGKYGSAADTFGEPHDERVHVRLRGARLYVTIPELEGPDGKPGAPWRQSFVVVSDQLRADGARLIEVVRPAQSSRSARYNERQMALWRGTSGGQPIDRMVGEGSLRIHNGRLLWSNVGYGHQHLAHGGSVPVTWVESFYGRRARKNTVRKIVVLRHDPAAIAETL